MKKKVIMDDKPNDEVMLGNGEQQQRMEAALREIEHEVEAS